MKTMFGYGSVMALAMAAVACGKSSDAPASSKLEVTGTVNTQLRSLDNASAVAIGSDGRTFSAYVQRNGRFKLSLPVGHVYRIVIANSTMRGELRPVGHLVNATSSGKSDVIAVKEGGRMNLGTLSPVGSTAGALHAACNCNTGASSSGSDGDKGDDGSYGGDKSDDNGKGDGSDKSDKSDKSDNDDGDYKTEQKDHDKDRVCDDGSDVELEADNSPGDKCAKESDDEDAPKVIAKSCQTKDENHDGKDDDVKGGSPGGGADKDGADKGAPDNSGPDKGVPDNGGADKGAPPAGSDPSSCFCGQQCGAGASCVASKCAPDKGAPSAK